MSIFKKITKIFTRTVLFVTVEMWSVRLEDYPKRIAFLLRYLRVIMVAFRRFTEDRIQLRASGLTYYTLLAIVPILAVGFGIAKGFGFDKDLEQELIANFKGQEEVLNWIITLAHSALDTVKSGMIAGIGLVMLVWSVMSVLGNIESSFNDIWQIRKQRSYVRRFTNYLSLMLVAPIFIFLANSGNLYMASKLSSISSQISIVNLSPFAVFLMKLIPYVMTWMLFTLLYVALPNTRVKFTSALLAGIIAGTAFQFVQWFYIDAQMFMTRTNAIYGSFAALPLLLIVLQLSWLIVLLGAEISFANQNIDLYELETESMQISPYARRAYNILLLEHIVQRFIDGKKPQTTHELASKTKLPIRLVGMVLDDLMASDLVSEIYTEKERLRAYAPARDVGKYTIKYVVESLDKSGNNSVLNQPANELRKVLHIQENFLRAMEQAPDNFLIQDICNYQIPKE